MKLIELGKGGNTVTYILNLLCEYFIQLCVCVFVLVDVKKGEHSEKGYNYPYSRNILQFILRPVFYTSRRNKYSLRRCYVIL